MTRERMMELIAEAEKVINDPAHAHKGFAHLCKSGVREMLTFLKTAAIMPKEPSKEVIAAMHEIHRKHWYGSSDIPSKPNDSQRIAMASVYCEVYNALTTPPKPKMKTVWCVAYKFRGQDSVYECATKQDAEELMSLALRNGERTHVSPIYELQVPA